MNDLSAKGLKGKQVVLRALCRSDLEVLRGFVNDPEVMQFSNQFQPITDYQQERWFENLGREHDSVWFGIVDTRGAAPILIGTCCLVGIDWISRMGELRIRIGDTRAWGKRLGTEACELLLCYGFVHLNLERLWLRVFGTNERALRMYRGLGFEIEGRLRQATYINGSCQDVVLMGLLRPEWGARSAFAGAGERPQ